MTQKHILLTGAAGGLGRQTAEYLAVKGWQVFATDSKEDALKDMRGNRCITTIPLDVTDGASIKYALEQVQKKTDKLDGIVNFAGILAVGSLIEICEDLFEKVLNVNILGTFRVNKAFFPLIFKGMGRIINISSETGWQSGAPFIGAYATSKHGIEAYTDSMRRELMHIGIPVIKIQPGPIRTDMVRNMKSQFDKASKDSIFFKRLLEKLGRMSSETSEKASDPTLIAKAVFKALTTSNPRSAYSIKPDHLRTFLDYLPVKMADALVKTILKMKK